MEKAAELLVPCGDQYAGISMERDGELIMVRTCTIPCFLATRILTDGMKILECRFILHGLLVSLSESYLAWWLQKSMLVRTHGGSTVKTLIFHGLSYLFVSGQC